MSNQEEIAEISIWDRVLGPFYTESAIVRSGLGIDGLIDIKSLTDDGNTLYPSEQFETTNGVLQRREKVIDVWNSLILPVINQGIIDELTATGLLLQHSGLGRSNAAILSDPSTDQSSVDAIILGIKRSLSSFKE